MLADLLVDAARRLDHLHEQFRTEVLWAAQHLERQAALRIGLINSSGVLQSRALKIDTLAARIYDGKEHLDALVGGYKDLDPPPQETSRPRPESHRAAQTQAPTAPGPATRRSPGATAGRTTSSPPAPTAPSSGNPARRR